MRRSPLLLSLLLVALLGPGCATAPPKPAASAPPADPAFMWEVKAAQGQGGTAYVVGSIHVGRGGELDLPPAMKKAFLLSDALVVEVDIGALDPSLLRRFIREKGLLPEGQQLSQRLDPETARLLEAAAKRAGLPMEGLEPLRPWVVAVTLSALGLRSSGYEAGLGLDSVFLGMARGAVEIVELETAEQQLQVFADLPEPVQEAMLRDQLHRLEEPQDELEHLTQAWQAGDAEAMAAQVFQREQTHPELRPLYEKLFYERNARMAEKVGAMLEQPRTWFVVVGAGHVVGPEGLLALLQKQGHSVRQLSKTP